MFQDGMEVFLDRSDANEFILSEYQFYHRFESIRQALEYDGILNGFYQHVGELKISDSWVIRKARNKRESNLARDTILVEEPNISYSGVERESDSESSLSEDSSSDQSNPNLSDQSNLNSTAAESISDYQSNLVRGNLAEVDPDQSSKDNTVPSIQTNAKSDKSCGTLSSPDYTAEDALIAGPLIIDSSKGFPTVEDLPIIPEDIASRPYTESRRTLDLETLPGFKTKWSSGNPTFKNVKLRIETVIKVTKRNLFDHYNRTDRFFPAFKFKINSEENGSIRPVGTLLLEGLIRRLYVCIEANRNTDTHVPRFFKSLYKTICHETFLSAKDFLIPLATDSTSLFENMGEIMLNFVRDVEELIDLIADTDTKNALREDIDVVREVLRSLDDIAGKIMNSVEILVVLLSVLVHHVSLVNVLPINVTSARLLSALHDFICYASEDTSFLIMSNLERWDIFVEKNNVILSYLGRV